MSRLAPQPYTAVATSSPIPPPRLGFNVLLLLPSAANYPSKSILVGSIRSGPLPQVTQVWQGWIISLTSPPCSNVFSSSLAFRLAHRSVLRPAWCETSNYLRPSYSYCSIFDVGVFFIVVTPSRIAQYLYDRARMLSQFRYGWLILFLSIGTCLFS